jgi:hypothetical protein
MLMKARFQLSKVELNCKILHRNQNKIVSIEHHSL